MAARSQSFDKLLLAFRWQWKMTIQLCRHLCPNNTVCITEGKLRGGGQFIGAIGGIEFKGASGGQLFGLDSERANYQCTNLQALLCYVQRLHEGSFCLLVVHVVAGRQAAHNSQDLLL